MPELIVGLVLTTVLFYLGYTIGYSNCQAKWRMLDVQRNKELEQWQTRALEAEFDRSRMLGQ